MKIKCLYNSGEVLLNFSRRPEGTSIATKYSMIEVNKEYLVMGIIQFETHMSYLIDDGLVFTCPVQLFEVIDSKLPMNWYFRIPTKEEDIYPYVEALYGYYELCFEKKAYENLIVEKDEASLRTYFRRKIEYEKTEDDF